MPQERENIFISYCRTDGKWLEMFSRMLVPLLRKKQLEIWADTNITPGTKWYEEIKKAVASSKIALLLVSPYFLASEFIFDTEMPLISEAQKDGLTILWVAVSRCLHQYTDLKKDQALNDPAKPLDTFTTPAKLNAEMVRICKLIKEAMDSPPQQSGGITLKDQSD